MITDNQIKTTGIPLCRPSNDANHIVTPDIATNLAIIKLQGARYFNLPVYQFSG